MKLLEKTADLLGFDYVGKFELEPLKRYRRIRNQMPWYKKYGLFSYRYFFDRFKPRNSFAAALRLAVQVLWIFTYTMAFGLWMTFAGELYDMYTVKRRSGHSTLEALRSLVYDDQLTLPGNPYREED